MSVGDFMEAWWLSLQPLLEAAGVIGHFERSPLNRPNPSCALNLRRHQVEADLVVWDSGEAELAAVEHDGSTSQQHFDDIRIPPNLSVILTRVVSLTTKLS
jgi:hypothetical protein